jgi:hypothetical protein
VSNGENGGSISTHLRKSTWSSCTPVSVSRPSLRLTITLSIYRTRAAAGMGSACGPGASPTPNRRESARAAPRTRKYHAGPARAVETPANLFLCKSIRQRPIGLLGPAGRKRKRTAGPWTHHTYLSSRLQRNYTPAARRPLCSPSKNTHAIYIRFEKEREGVLSAYAAPALGPALLLRADSGSRNLERNMTRRRSIMMPCQMVKMVAQYQRTCANQLGPHVHRCRFRDPVCVSPQRSQYIESERQLAGTGMGSACGTGASPTPNRRESARAAPRTRKYHTGPACDFF